MQSRQAPFEEIQSRQRTCPCRARPPWLLPWLMDPCPLHAIRALWRRGPAALRVGTTDSRDPGCNHLHTRTFAHPFRRGRRVGTTRVQVTCARSGAPLPSKYALHHDREREAAPGASEQAPRAGTADRCSTAARALTSAAPLTAASGLSSRAASSKSWTGRPSPPRRRTC